MQTSPFLKMASSPGCSVFFSAVPLIGNAIPGLAAAASGVPGSMPAAMPMPALLEWQQRIELQRAFFEWQREGYTWHIVAASASRSVSLCRIQVFSGAELRSPGGGEVVPLFSASAVFSALVKYIGRPSSDCNEVTLRYVLGELRLGKYLQHNSEAPSPIGVFLDPPAVLAMMQLPRFQVPSALLNDFTRGVSLLYHAGAVGAGDGGAGNARGSALPAKRAKLEAPVRGRGSPWLAVGDVLRGFPTGAVVEYLVRTPELVARVLRHDHGRGLVEGVLRQAVSVGRPMLNKLGAWVLRVVGPDKYDNQFYPLSRLVSAAVLGRSVPLFLGRKAVQEATKDLPDPLVVPREKEGAGKDKEREKEAEPAQHRGLPFSQGQLRMVPEVRAYIGQHGGVMPRRDVQSAEAEMLCAWVTSRFGETLDRSKTLLRTVRPANEGDGGGRVGEGNAGGELLPAVHVNPGASGDPAPPHPPETDDPGGIASSGDARSAPIPPLACLRALTARSVCVYASSPRCRRRLPDTSVKRIVHMLSFE